MKFTSSVKAACFCLCIFSLLACKDNKTSTVPDPKTFKKPPAAYAVHTWWHWMDNAISREGITADLEAMKREGISTATILNVSLFEEKDLGIKPVIFNSPEWYAMFRWALEEAERLGIKIGVHNCDGWSTSGGPWISPELSMKHCVWRKTVINGGSDTIIQLKKPACTLDFYRDIAVLAYLSPSKQNKFANIKPFIEKDGKNTGDILYDGNPFSMERLTGDHQFDIRLPAKINASRLVFHARKEFQWGNTKTLECVIEIQAHSVGSSFRTIAQFRNPDLNRSNIFDFPSTTSSRFRIRISNLVDYEAYNPTGIAELEILDEYEKPSYHTEIPSHLEKTVTTKPHSSEEIYLEGPETSGIDLSGIIDLTSFMNKDGSLNWNAPPGEWTILRIGYTTTGAVNAPATRAGTGLECDKMDTSALNHHFSHFPSSLVKEAGPHTGHTFDYLFVDSWECRYQNWTESFPDEFQKRRGYNIIPWLAVIAGEVITGQEETERFLHDYRLTIADLIEDNYYKHFHELCHRLGLKSHAEVIYGGTGYPPLDVLRTNRYFDVPMFEFWAGLEPSTGLIGYKPVNRSGTDLPMHAASVYGKELMPAEAYTGFANYSESPWDLKLHGDRAFCSGINMMVLHSYVHQPDERKPGTTLGGFGQTFNRHNPWWNFSSQWFDYHSRVQYLLQKGTRKSDLLCFMGDRLYDPWTAEWEQNLPVGISIQKCNADILKNHASVKKGKIRLDNGLDYKILLLPDDQKMDLLSLEAIASLVKAGAVVMGTKPQSTLSLLNKEENDRKLAALAEEIWGEEYDASGKIIREPGKGKVYSGYSIEEVLMEEKHVPSLTWDDNEKIPLLFIHKQDIESEFWFMVNQEDKEAIRTCTFISSFKNLSIWDPMDGNIYRPGNEKRNGDTISMDITFPGKASFFVVSSDKPMGELPGHGYWNGKYILKDYTISIGTQGFGKEMKQMNSLDFFNNTDELKYHSGEAYYEIQFDLPDTVVNNSPKYLSCGEVYDGYEVILNGQTLGEAVFPYFRFELPEIVKVSGNVLQVKTGNAYRNRLIGNNLQQVNPYGLWTTSPAYQLPGSGMPLKNAGMKGPVTFFW